MGIIGLAVGTVVGTLIGGLVGGLLGAFLPELIGSFVTLVSIVAGGIFGFKTIGPRIPI